MVQQTNCSAFCGLHYDTIESLDYCKITDTDKLYYNNEPVATLSRTSLQGLSCGLVLGYSVNQKNWLELFEKWVEF